MRWLDSITDAMNMKLGRLQEMVKDGEAWHAEVHGVAESDMTCVTEQQQHANDIQIYISNSDFSPELQTLNPISSLTFQLVCLEGILNQFQDQIPYVFPKLVSSTIFPISVKGKSFAPDAQAKT